MHNRVYVRKEDFKWYWNHAIPMSWPDVKLAEHWYLNPQWFPVPSMPTSRRGRDLEIQRRRVRLPASARNDPVFAATSRNWDAWFHDEHNLWR